MKISQFFIDFLSEIIHVIIMLRNIIRFAVRKAASDPRVRAKATEAARKIAKGAGDLAREPEPAKKLGRLAGRIKKRIINN